MGRGSYLQKALSEARSRRGRQLSRMSRRQNPSAQSNGHESQTAVSRKAEEDAQDLAIIHTRQQVSELTAIIKQRLDLYKELHRTRAVQYKEYVYLPLPPLVRISTILITVAAQRRRLGASTQKERRLRDGRHKHARAQKAKTLPERPAESSGSTGNPRQQPYQRSSRDQSIVEGENGCLREG